MMRLLLPELLPDKRISIFTGAGLLSSFGLDDSVLHADERTRVRAWGALSGDDVVVRVPLDRIDVETDGEDCVEHDRYFGVERVGGDPGEVFLAGLLVSYLDVIDNVDRMGASLTDEQWHDLMRAPAALFGFALGRDELPPAPMRARGGEYLPHERWQVCHRQFFALIQAISVALGGLLRATEDDDVPAMREWVELATPLVLASAVSLRLCADFRPEDYADDVRSSMEPPHVGTGFSGLQTRDHRYLVRLFGRLRAALPSLEPVREEYEEFVAAVEKLYDAHEWVCSRFGGDERPSLRMEAASKGRAGKTGVQVVREFAAHRLSLIGRRDGHASRSEPARRSAVQVVLLTGLPSAGKSTIASRACQELRERRRRCVVLDGDVVRREFWPELGMAPQDRTANLQRVGGLAGMLASQGVVVLVAVIAPYARDREMLRASLLDKGIGFAEVHVATPVEVCRFRDVKGLYARRVTQLTGVDAPYEAPTDPDLAIDTTWSTVDESVQELLTFLSEKGMPSGGADVG